MIQKGKQAGAQQSITGKKRTQEGVWTWAEQQEGLDYSWDLMVIMSGQDSGHRVTSQTASSLVLQSLGCMGLASAD